jgi:transcriptional regulator with XRE-family HTH domain
MNRMKKQTTASTKNSLKMDVRGIGLRIRGLRGETRQQAFASELGISQSQLSKIESGNVSPTIEFVLRLASKFRKSIDWIVTGKGCQ